MMVCPLCGSDSRVIDTRTLNGNVWRRRDCQKCRHRWSTYEITERAFKHVEKVEAIVASIVNEER